MVPVTDLPRTPLAGDLVVLELLDRTRSSTCWPSRRGVATSGTPTSRARTTATASGSWRTSPVGVRAGSCAGPTAWWSASVGFFGPPEPADDGVPEVEVGYGLVAAARRQGLMRDVLTVLLRLTDAAGVRVRGATTRDNAASLASLRGAGFAVRDVRETPDDPERQVHLVREPGPDPGPAGRHRPRRHAGALRRIDHAAHP